MLDKIININTDVRLRSDDKYSRNNRYSKKKGAPQMAEKDSLLFSPAALYLAELDWELHNLDYPAENCVSLEFVINNLLFRIKIDFSNYFVTPEQVIFISYQIKDKKISLFTLLAKRKLWFIDHYKPIELKGLEQLFEIMYNSTDENNQVNSFAVEKVLAELETKLNSELQYILASVFTFLDKLGKFKIIKNFRFNNNSAELVKIEKVIVQNAR